MNLHLHLLSAIAALGLVVSPAKAFPGTHGVSLIGMTRVVQTERGYAYAPLPAYGPPLYARLRASGVDLVRLVVRPLPLMAGSLEEQEHALLQLLEIVGQLSGARIATIVDLHPWPPDTVEQEEQLICTPDGSAMLERVLLNLAQALVRTKINVALELLNEPKRCTVDGHMRWAGLQQYLFEQIRAVAPSLTLIVTAPAGQLDDLLAFDATPYVADPNVLFSFHFYEPFIFTTPSFFAADPVPFPSPGSVAAGGAAFAKADRSKMSIQHSGDLWRYLTRPNDDEVIAARFAALDRWRRAAGVPASRIVLGEYGIVRPSTSGNAEDYTSSARWLKAVTQSALRNGFLPIFWQWPAKPNYFYDSAQSWLRRDASDAIGINAE